MSSRVRPFRPLVKIQGVSWPLKLSLVGLLLVIVLAAWVLLMG
jgi:hypothetical protein